MGCDIHICTEKKRQRRDAWVSCDSRKPDPDYEDDPNATATVFAPYIDIDRNYDLFAVLAGVRSRLAIAPVSLPRGLPMDVSPETYAEANSWFRDGHSWSWLLVSELLQFDWNQDVVSVNRIVSALDYLHLIRTGTPPSWSAEDHANARVFTEEEFTEFMENTISEAERNSIEEQYQAHVATNLGWFFQDGTLARMYIRATWTEPLHHLVPEFYSKALPRLLELGDPEQTRIVFWFDN